MMVLLSFSLLSLFVCIEFVFVCVWDLFVSVEFIMYSVYEQVKLFVNVLCVCFCCVCFVSVEG